jgi:hypothetical protein
MKEKTAPPNSGQVPVAMPMDTSTTTAQQTEMMMTPNYALYFSIGSLLLLVIAGAVIFRRIAHHRRYCKPCRNCGAHLERWADECGMCKKSIFVYPAST